MQQAQCRCDCYTPHSVPLRNCWSSLPRKEQGSQAASLCGIKLTTIESHTARILSRNRVKEWQSCVGDGAHSHNIKGNVLWVWEHIHCKRWVSRHGHTLQKGRHNNTMKSRFIALFTVFPCLFYNPDTELKKLRFFLKMFYEKYLNLMPATCSCTWKGKQNIWWHFLQLIKLKGSSLVTWLAMMRGSQ